MNTLVVAPHPDDELLGCGGTLLKRLHEGNTIGWIIMSELKESNGWSDKQIKKRNYEIDQVRQGLGILPRNLFRLGFSPAELDIVPTNTVVSAISSVFKKFAPEDVILPHPGDVHTDHKITFEAACACTKWFRYPTVKRVSTYETLSETDFGFDQLTSSFKPNFFVDISDQLPKKLKLLSLYESEISDHPFPRSLLSIKSLAYLRGSQSGFKAAEAFQIHKMID